MLFHLLMALSIAPGNITGVVSDSSTGQPLPATQVTVLQAGQIVATTSTDAFGRYLLHNLPPGRYQVRVRFPGFTPADANPDIGDSTITETAGIGGFAMAAAPAIVTFVGSTPKDATNATLEMYEITAAEHKYFTIPALDFRGTPTGVDIRKVVEKGIPPRINTGIAHKQAGVGQVGAGLVRPPMKIFEDALVAFAEKYKL